MWCWGFRKGAGDVYRGVILFFGGPSRYFGVEVCSFVLSFFRSFLPLCLEGEK